MNKFLKSFLLFIPFAIGVYLLCLLVVGTLQPTPRLKSNFNYSRGAYGHTYTRLQEVKKVNNIDILFLGSSHSYRGFDTRFFSANGYRSFNLGSIAQTPMQTDVLLKRYLKQLDPSIIVYEVYPVTFGVDGVESALDLIANDKNDRYSVNMALEANDAKVYNTLVYGFMRDLFHINRPSFVEQKNKDNDTYIAGGFVEKKMEYYHHYNYPPTALTFNKEQLNIFGCILDSIKNETKSKVILVYAPVTPNLYNSYTNNNEFDSIMSSYGTYYNLNKMLSLDDSLDFYDYHHLNQNGVQIVDRKMLEILRDNQRGTSLTVK